MTNDQLGVQLTATICTVLSICSSSLMLLEMYHLPNEIRRRPYQRLLFNLVVHCIFASFAQIFLWGVSEDFLCILNAMGQQFFQYTSSAYCTAIAHYLFVIVCSDITPNTDAQLKLLKNIHIFVFVSGVVFLVIPFFGSGPLPYGFDGSWCWLNPNAPLYYTWVWVCFYIPVCFMEFYIIFCVAKCKAKITRINNESRCMATEQHATQSEDMYSTISGYPKGLVGIWAFGSIRRFVQLCTNNSKTPYWTIIFQIANNSLGGVIYFIIFRVSSKPMKYDPSRSVRSAISSVNASVRQTFAGTSKDQQSVPSIARKQTQPGSICMTSVVSTVPEGSPDSL